MNDELKELIGKILRIDVAELSIPIYGKLLEVSTYWIVIEKRDGEHRIVSLGRIRGIEPVEDQ